MSELDRLLCIYNTHGGVSTKLLHTTYLNQQQTKPAPFELTNYRLTTQTMVLELQGIKFNDFAIQADQLGRCLQQLMILGSPVIPSNLIGLKAKKFEIQLDHRQRLVYVKKNYISVTHEMNSSIDFQFYSLYQNEERPTDAIQRTRTRQHKTKASNQKVYQLRLFRNGMLQIPGVVDMYDRSEAKVIVESLIALYQEIFETGSDIKVLHKNIAMMNFVTHMMIPENTVIDLTSLAFDVKRDAGQSFQQQCNRVDLRCLYFDIAVRRVVLYCKFAIPKERTQFSHYNPSSTSNRKESRAITFQITQKGIVMIQGADGNFHKTADIIKKFQMLLTAIAGPYIKPILGHSEY